MHVIAAKAVCFHEAMQPEFLEYQKAVLENALTLAGELERGGLRLVSGGTDNHLLLADLTGTGVNGLQAEEALESAGIVVNRNAIPFDTLSPRLASGIRLGTPAVTARGMGEDEMKRIAELILKVIRDIRNQQAQEQVREEVKELCRQFPVPGIDR